VIEYDWLVVTSPNGASAYADARAGGGRTGAVPRGVAAVGAATAAALGAVGIKATLVPSRQSAAGLLAEFPPFTGAGAGTGRVLVVQAFGAEPALAEGLAAKGWQVTMNSPYRSRATTPTPGGQLAALAADAVLFASGSAARSWAAVFGGSTPPIVVAIGPQTAAAATRAGLKVSLVAADHSLPGMVAALERHLAGGE
jgi:uroporphyrinogen-III synthase